MFSRPLILFVFAILGSVCISAQNPSPTVSPTPFAVDKQGVAPEKLTSVPAIAPNYSSQERGLPDLGRVGVDLADQKTLTLNEAVLLALDSNRDIEVTRKNVLIAEFDLKAARGVYEPRFNGQLYYDRATVPKYERFR